MITKAIAQAMKAARAAAKDKAEKALSKENKLLDKLKAENKAKYAQAKANKGKDISGNIKSPKFVGPRPKTQEIMKQESSQGTNIFKKTLGSRSTPDTKVKDLLKKDMRKLKEQYGTTDKDLIERIKKGRELNAADAAAKRAKMDKAGSYTTADRPGRKPGDTEAWAGWGRYGKAGKPKYKKGGKIGMGMTKNNYKKGGKVSSCSKRADGCAVKGKTKGRMI